MSTTHCKRNHCFLPAHRAFAHQRSCAWPGSCTQPCWMVSAMRSEHERQKRARRTSTYGKPVTVALDSGMASKLSVSPGRVSSSLGRVSRVALFESVLPAEDEHKRDNPFVLQRRSPSLWRLTQPALAVRARAPERHRILPASCQALLQVRHVRVK